MSQADQHTQAMESTTAQILRIFDRIGLRNTRQRRLIAERLAALTVTGVDFTAQDFWHDLLRDDPRLGRATVYRAVDILLGEGFLDRISFADGTHRYRVCGSAHHHHMTCVRCQRVVEIDACLPPALFAAIATKADFAIEGHSLELFGRCAACRQAEAPDASATV
ncbi:MAG: Fur family transcriptional regulator [Ktedonobacterales bacterium]